MLTRRWFLLSALSVAAWAALCSGASAQITLTEYTDRAAFDAATHGVTTFTFDGYAPVNSRTAYPDGLTIQGVAFTDPNRDLFVDDPGSGFGDSFGGHQYLSDGANINVALPAGTTAFGTDVTSVVLDGIEEVTVDGQFFDVNVNNGEASEPPVFIGFTSNAPLTGLGFANTGDFFSIGQDLDTISIGQDGPSPAPEPSEWATLGLTALLLSGLAVAARRRTRRQGLEKARRRKAPDHPCPGAFLTHD